MDKLLKGIRVLDLTQAYSGPFCCMHLADHGAEVIKIEPPGGDQTRRWDPIKNNYSAYFAYFNRNKKGICLNLKTEDGKEALRRLIAKSDVVIENFKAGTFARLGFTYESMKAINPRIIYGQITGFGLSGPMSGRPAYDLVAQAEGGMMSMNGYPDRQGVKVGPSIADSFSGTYLALAVMMALLNRERTGEGSHVDVAMLDTVFSVLESYVLDYTLLGKVPLRTGSQGTSNAPWNSFYAKNGNFVAGCGTNKQWEALCEALGLHDMTHDERFDSPRKRVANVDYIEKRINTVCADLNLDEIETRLTEASIPFGRVNNVKQASELEQIRVRNMLWEIFDPGLGEILKMPGTPMKFSNEPDCISCAAPTLGQDNMEVLCDIAGYTKQEAERISGK